MFEEIYPISLPFFRKMVEQINETYPIESLIIETHPKEDTRRETSQGVNEVQERYIKIKWKTDIVNKVNTQLQPYHLNTSKSIEIQFKTGSITIEDGTTMNLYGCYIVPFNVKECKKEGRGPWKMVMNINAY